MTSVGVLLAAGSAFAGSVTDPDPGGGQVQSESLFATSGETTFDPGSFSTPPTDGLIGDMNHDGAVDAIDVSHFVLALTNPAEYANLFGIGPDLVGDINLDGAFDASDVSPFVQMLTSGSSGGSWTSLPPSNSDGQQPNVAPLPGAGWAGLALLGTLGVARGLRRRRPDTA
ncbi:MAG: hypothetical protein WD316_08640 [Phycisphaeraceae bacterium]